MDNQSCRKLIQLYGSKDLLWNSKSRFYYKKALREDAWREISAEMGVSVPELKKKMTVLLSSYRREKWRISKSQLTGSGRNRIYVSKWFGFDDFSFMEDRLTPNDATNIKQEPASYNDGESSQEPSKKNEEHVAECSLNTNEKIPEKPAKKPKKRKHDEEENEMLTEAFKNLTETSQATDPYFSYGQHIANELRKYDNRTLIFVKQAINNVIFEADLGKYASNVRDTTRYSKFFNTKFKR